MNADRDPKTGEEAIDLVITWFKNAASEEEPPLSEDCWKKFKKENLDGFNQAFAEGKWDKSKKVLEVVAGVHGTMSAVVAKTKDPKATKVSLDVFEHVGKRVKKHCPKGGIPRGDWCQWP